MLDIQFVRDNAELVQKKADQKNIKIHVSKLLELDSQRRELQGLVDELRAKRNEVASRMKGGKPDPDVIAEGKRIKAELSGKEALLQSILGEFNDALEAVPNVFPDDTPLGGEEANKPIKHVGEATERTVKDHLTWGEERGLIDFEKGAQVAGNKFYYLKGDLVTLELACIQLAITKAAALGFTPMTVPHMVNTKTMSGTGYMPRGEERQVYGIDGEDLNLIATAEIPITGYHADEIIDEARLPILYVGLSPAYRMEAGAYGKHSRGLYRVHQFNKVELYVFCKPEQSEQWHEKLLALEEELCQALDIPYQVVRIAAGDLGGPAYKKYDVEYWSPVEGTYRELMSCSNVTDYQARRLNIRYKTAEGVSYVHTLNGTAMAFSRTAIALLENHQQPDGSVLVPKALQPFMNGKDTIK